jgi:hypothetical protein
MNNYLISPTGKAEGLIIIKDILKNNQQPKDIIKVKFSPYLITHYAIMTYGPFSHISAKEAQPLPKLFRDMTLKTAF